MSKGDGQIDVVTYDSSNEFMAVYLDGELITSGDEYHNKIREYIDGFFFGLDTVEVDYFRKDHEISEEMEVKFADDGYVAPEKFPNEYITKGK